LRNDARLRALDIALKVKGSYSLAVPEDPVQTGVMVIIVDAPRPDRTNPQPWPDLKPGMTEEEYRTLIPPSYGSSGK
jgi:hypothetical protein